MKTITRAAAALLLAAGFATGAQAVEFTGTTGSGQAFSNYQSSLVMASYVQTQGIYPRRPDDFGNANVAYFGAVRTFAFPVGRLSGFANGQLQGLNQNTALFSLLGTNFGGDGRSTFGLPNLQGSTMVGVGRNNRIGQASGSATTTLTLANLPAHDHDLPNGATTGVTGSASPAAFDNRQPSLTLNYGIAVNGYFGTSDDLAAIGEVRAFAGDYVPAGYMIANGQELNIAEYTALATILGTTYGGDGVTTFRLPDLAGRAVVGASNGAPGAGTTVTDIALGGVQGSATTTLTAANLPSHTHTVPGAAPTAPEGAGQAIAQEQPSLGLNYMIALQGIFPSFESVAPEGPVIGEISAFAGSTAFVPRGWALADGRLMAVNQNQALFALIGTTYGGNGTTTFALPDLRGRTIVGAGSANGVGYSVGQQIGISRYTLAAADLPAHSHALPAIAAVPEPATWGMMLLGFGLAGASMRRRRSTTVTYA